MCLNFMCFYFIFSLFLSFFFLAKNMEEKNRGRLSEIKYAMHFVGEASAMRFAESICFDKFLRLAHNLTRVSLCHIQRVIVLLYSLHSIMLIFYRIPFLKSTRRSNRTIVRWNPLDKVNRGKVNYDGFSMGFPHFFCSLVCC